LAASVVIAVHHLAFNFMQAADMGVYVLVEGANLPLILIHAAFVVAEAGMLIYMAHQLRMQASESMQVAILAERIGQGDLTQELPPGAQVEQVVQRPEDRGFHVGGFARSEVHVLGEPRAAERDPDAGPSLEDERVLRDMSSEEVLHVVPLDGMQGDTPGPGLGGELRPGERLNPPRGC